MNNLIASYADSKMLATLRKRCATHSQMLNEKRRQFKDAVDIQKR
jgi:hypothetical protein